MGVASMLTQPTDMNNHVPPSELWGSGTVEHASSGNEETF